LIAKTVEEFGSIDILVNNAGMIRRAPTAEYQQNDWDEVIAVNLTAVFRLSQLAGQNMLKREAKGKIVNIASILSFQAASQFRRMPPQGRSGAAYQSSGQRVGGEGHQRQRDCACYMATDNTTALRQDPQRSRQIMERIPAGRWGESADLAGAAVFLCSSASDYVHGLSWPSTAGG